MRMADDRLPNRAAELREQGKRRRGMPMLRWEDCVKRDVRKAEEEEDWKKKTSRDSENVQVSGLNVRCQRRSRERCKQQSKYCLVKVEGNYRGDVRQEYTNKVERQSVQDGYKIGHGVWCRVLRS